MESDLPAITNLFAETIKNINSGDYSPEQVRLWASSAANTKMWQERMARQYFIVTENEGGIITGFASIEPDGYLDFLYVHKDFQRQGIAKTLLEEIERKATGQGNTKIYSHVSKTAKGFFEKFGYKHEGDELSSGFEYADGKNKPVSGITFVNSIMIKQLK